MKELSSSTKQLDEKAASYLPKAAEVIGHIAGLERLLPGHYRPGSTVRSPYGLWILPLCFKGRRLTAIIDAAMIG